MFIVRFADQEKRRAPTWVMVEVVNGGYGFFLTSRLLTLSSLYPAILRSETTRSASFLLVTSTFLSSIFISLTRNSLTFNFSFLIFNFAKISQYSFGLNA